MNTSWGKKAISNTKVDNHEISATNYIVVVAVLVVNKYFTSPFQFAICLHMSHPRELKLRLI